MFARTPTIRATPLGGAGGEGRARETTRPRVVGLGEDRAQGIHQIQGRGHEAPGARAVERGIGANHLDDAIGSKEICATHGAQRAEALRDDVEHQRALATTRHSTHTQDPPEFELQIDPREVVPRGTDDARALAAKMSGALVAFARSGDPNHAGLPTWPAYTPASRPTMVFENEKVSVMNDPDREARALVE